MDKILPIFAFVLSVSSIGLPVIGFLSLFVLGETWRGPGTDRKPWFRRFYVVCRYYVFTVLIVANLWLLAGALVINTDFWSLYDPALDADPSTALEAALEHWDELQ